MFVYMGFNIYKTKIVMLNHLLFQVHDRAQAFIACSGTARAPTFVGVIERWSNRKLILPKLSCESRVKLLILVLLSCNQWLYEVKQTIWFETLVDIICVFVVLVIMLSLHLQVENLGRINYGPYLYDRKVLDILEVILWD